MEFRAKITNVKTDKDYSGNERVAIEFDAEDGPGAEVLYFGMKLPKHHPMVIEYMQAWQNGQVVSVSINLK